MKPILLALVGPTGVGKTQVSLDVASALNAEILSMDSMQIYRGMDIGTAKSSVEERRNIVHHMIDVANPSERFTVADYRDQAIPIIDDILSRGKQPMLVGGTGLYLDAIRYDMNLGRKGADESIRLRLRKIAEEPDGQLRLHEMLRAVDPQTAEKLHPNDVRRVMRLKSTKPPAKPRASRRRARERKANTMYWFTGCRSRAKSCMRESTRAWMK